jgi:hypothetical protein
MALVSTFVCLPACFYNPLGSKGGPGSSVGIATDYGLGDREIESDVQVESDKLTV